jgi:hypothetical protein
VTSADESGNARPERPQYGEYATPEEVAAARGLLPAAQPDPVPAPGAGMMPPPTGSPVVTGAAARHPRQANNLITVFLLIVGLWNTITSIPSYLDLGPALTQGLEAAGYGSVTFGAAAHTAGIVLLVFSLLVLIVAAGLALRLIRLGRRSVWVPLAAAGVFVLGSIVVMTVVVANTPALADVLHNH